MESSRAATSGRAFPRLFLVHDEARSLEFGEGNRRNRRGASCEGAHFHELLFVVLPGLEEEGFAVVHLRLCPQQFEQGDQLLVELLLGDRERLAALLHDLLHRLPVQRRHYRLAVGGRGECEAFVDRVGVLFPKDLDAEQQIPLLESVGSGEVDSVRKGEIRLLVAPILVEPLARLRGERNRWPLDGQLRAGGEEARLDLLPDGGKVVVPLHHEREILCLVQGRGKGCEGKNERKQERYGEERACFHEASLKWIE